MYICNSQFEGFYLGKISFHENMISYIVLPMNNYPFPFLDTYFL